MSGPVKIPAPRNDVALRAGYHSPQLEVEVRLNVNEAPELPPDAFLDELAGAVRTMSWNRYPDRAATDLRASVAAHHGVAPEAVFCANGSNEVLQSLLLAYGGPGRSVAVFEPSYALYAHIAHVTGTAVVSGERGGDFLLDPADVEATLARARAEGPAGDPQPVITFLCSPNNPTGRLEPAALVDHVLEHAPGLVVIDEAYGQFAPRSAIERLAGDPRIVVVRTFSKTWSLAGMRLGYAVADPAVIAAMERVVLPYHLDILKQRAGVLALQHEGEMRQRVARLVAERTRVGAGLEALSCRVVPSDANFILFAPPTEDVKRVWSVLVEHSVLVRDVSSWPRLSAYLRVTIGTPEENDRFLAALASALDR